MIESTIIEQELLIKEKLELIMETTENIKIAICILGALLLVIAICEIYRTFFKK